MDKVMDVLDEVEKQFSNIQLKVGFLEGATYNGVIPVPMVAATNEFGNPAHNQPPRPFFRNAIAENEEKWKEKTSQLIERGDDIGEIFSILGEIIVGDIRQSIITLESPPLSPVTIAKKGFDKPLIDTKNMLDSISYEVGEIEPSTDSQ
ncbi:hypothetical protein ACW6AV_001656 [Edwardsiella piscicida]|uniref:hypothetical protein n=1 Tax=Edwardsiella piscicida TaxID=1263550 RepID=UPI000D516D60|nr:hypothetical protein [Edwardsiella piscicida]ELM3659802.1 hypothetical protein [Edwardsiella piscicida]UCQ36392.1 hypothetical protein DCF36_09020 [Edwardsiella piscicida]